MGKWAVSIDVLSQSDQIHNILKAVYADMRIRCWWGSSPSGYRSLICAALLGDTRLRSLQRPRLRLLQVSAPPVITLYYYRPRRPSASWVFHQSRSIFSKLRRRRRARRWRMRRLCHCWALPGHAAGPQSGGAVVAPEERQTRIPTVPTPTQHCVSNSPQHGASYKLQVRIVRLAVTQLLDDRTLGFKRGPRPSIQKVPVPRQVSR